MNEHRMMSMEDVKKKARQLNTALSDDEMALASGGVRENYPPPKFHVGDHVKMVDWETADDIVILEVKDETWYDPTEGWFYIIKVHEPGIGWLEGGASEIYMLPA